MYKSDKTTCLSSTLIKLVYDRILKNYIYGKKVFVILEVTFNFSKWKADVTRFVQVSPSNEDNPKNRRLMRGLRGGLTKCPFLFVKINLVNSTSAIMSLGLLPNQHNEMFPTRK